MSDPAPSGVGSHLARGTVWGILQVGVQKLCGIATYLAMAFLLEPSQLGAATFAVSVTAMLTLIYPGASGDLVIQRPGDGPSTSAAATRLALLSGFGVVLLAAIASPAIASWKSDATLTALLMVASTRMLFEGVASVPLAQARSRLEYGFVSAIETGMAMLTVVLTVGFAVSGLGALSIVLAVAIAGASRVIALAVLRPWPWRSSDGWIATRRLWPDFRAGGLQHFLNGVTQNIDYVMLGAFASETVLGVYAIAYQLASMVQVVFSFTIGLAAQPLFSRMAADRELQRSMYLETQAVGLAISSVVALVMASLAQATLPWLLPEKWHAAGGLLAILAFGFGLGSLQPIAQSLLRANGEYAKALRLQIAAMVVLGSGVLAGAWLDGARGVAIAVSTVTAVMAMVHLAASLPAPFRRSGCSLALRTWVCSVAGFAPALLALVAHSRGWLPWAPLGSGSGLGFQVLLALLGTWWWWLLTARFQPRVRERILARLRPVLDRSRRSTG